MLTTLDALIGRKLGGRVEVQAALGAGGMGRVYRGWHHELGLPVAVKVLSVGGQLRSDAVKRLQVEVAAARSIQHPNVVRVYEAATDLRDGLVYVVMEFVDGKDLASLLTTRRRLDWQRACRIMLDVSAALDAAHQANVLHRDVKPANIMLTRVRQGGTYVDSIKLVDFGLAKLTAGENTSLTGTGMTLGTPGFMAPEQLLGEELDGRADVFSCGVTLYRLISGELPWPGRELGVLLRAMARPPPRLEGVPEGLEQAIFRALAPDRPSRHQSARAFAAAIAPFVDAEVAADVSEAAPMAGARPLRLDVALGLDEPQGLTRADRPVVLREPLAEAIPGAAPADAEVEVAPAPVAPKRPAHVESPPQRPVGAGFERPSREWVLGAIAASLVAGLAGAALGVYRESHRLEARVGRALLTGANGAAESLLLDELLSARKDPANAVLVSATLAPRVREAGERFDPVFRLEAGTFEGSVTVPRQDLVQHLTLSVDQVDRGFFVGTLKWPASGAEAVVHGLHEGNLLVFSDVAPLGRPLEGYRYNEKKVAFVLLGSDGVVLWGTDGPFHAPFEAVRVTPGARPLASREPRVELTDQALTEWIAWRGHMLKVLREGSGLLDTLAQQSPSDARGEDAEDIRDELAARRARVLADAPVSTEQVRALEGMVAALFRESSGPSPLPRNDPDRERAALALYGETFERVRARRTEMFEAWFKRGR